MSNPIGMSGEVDLCGLLIVMAIAYVAGSRLVEGSPARRTSGLRCGYAAFALNVASDYWASPPTFVDDLLRTSVVGMLVGTQVAIAMWFVLACGGGFVELQRALARRFRRWSDARRNSKQRQCQQQEEQRRQRELDRDAPRRERELRESQARERTERTRRDVAQAEREEARVACEILYNLREADIAERYPRQQFDEFVAKYMSDDRSVEIVKKRAAQLQQLIHQHFEKVEPTDEFRDLGDVTEWYLQQQQLIEQLAVQDEYRKTFLVQLNGRFSELCEKILEPGQ